MLELRHSPLPDGGAVWLLSETTERKRIDERLEEIRRVETLGKVTGEVAHDFGNILSSISGNMHLLSTATEENASRVRERIGAALDLGVSLTERLLAFARKQHLEPQVTDVAQLIEGMADLLEIALLRVSRCISTYPLIRFWPRLTRASWKARFLIYASTRDRPSARRAVST